MRLICPNCSAQYEVDSSVIPDAGRDVQCSNCGHTWFQDQSQQDGELGVQQASVAAASVAPASPAPDPVPTPDPAPEMAAPEPADVQPAEEPIAATEAATEKSEAPEPATPQRQPMDQGAEDILRQEAELEAAQRGPATETDNAPATMSPMASSEPAAAIAETRSANLHGLASDRGNSDNRRDLLPDIEEINSTLVAASPTLSDEENEVIADTRRRGGFRWGFVAAVAIFSILALTYMFAPNIADTVPGTATSLASYVDWVNAMRVSVDGVMLGAVEKLTGILAQISGDKAS